MFIQSNFLNSTTPTFLSANRDPHFEDKVFAMAPSYVSLSGIAFKRSVKVTNSILPFSSFGNPALNNFKTVGESLAIYFTEACIPLLLEWIK